MPQSNSYSAAILAGGQSTRFGSDKALLQYNGQSLIEFIAGQLKTIADDIVLCGKNPEEFNFPGIKVVPDMVPGLGPLMGIATSLKHVEHDICFITGCDIPIINIQLVEHMFKLSEHCDIVIPKNANGNLEPLFAVYRKSLLTPALKIIHAGGRRIVELIQNMRVMYVDFNPGLWFKNINTIADFKSFNEKTLIK